MLLFNMALIERMPQRSSRACTGRCWVLALTVALFCLQPRALQADGRASRWTWVSLALGQLVAGEHAKAVASVARARASGASAELDALVGLIGASGGARVASRRQIEHAITQGSTEPWVLYWAGRAALAPGVRGAARRRMEQAIAVGGDRPALWMGYALVLTAAGQRLKAARSLGKVAALTPNLLDPSLYPTAAAGAIDLLPVLMRRFPFPRQVRRTAAYLQWKLERVWPALSAFRRLARQRKGDADALQMIARALLALGEKKQALLAARRAVAAAPDSIAAASARGLARLESGDAEGAVKDLRRVANARPRSVEALYQLARACDAAEKRKCARRFYQYALLRDPRHAEARFGLGVLRAQRGAHRQALRSFALAIAADPGDARYYQAAAQSAQALGDGRRAKRLLAEAKVAKRSGRRFANKREVALRTARAMNTAIQLCGCEGKAGCLPAKKACKDAVKRLPPSPRRFFMAHLAIKRGAKPQVIGLTARLRPRRLLLNDPTLLKQKRKTLGGISSVVRTHLPMVPPAAFR